MGGHEDLPDVLGDLLYLIYAALLCHLVHQFTAVEAPRLCHPLKIGIYFNEYVIVHDAPYKAEGEEGLDTAGAACDDAQGPRGRYGGCGGVSVVAALPVFKDALFKIGKESPFLGKGL